MTSQEINEAREKKKKEDLKFVADSVNNGLSAEEIRKLKPEFGYNEVSPLIKELIDLGSITQEQVNENATNARRKAMNKSVELSPDEQVSFILDKVRMGYMPIEIVESDKTKSITMHKVLYQKRQLIAKGIISEEEAQQAMKKRQEEAIAKKRTEVMNKVKEYTELGYTLTEISNFIPEYGYGFLRHIKTIYAEKNGWYTKEQLKEFAKLRKLREAEEAKRAFENLPPEEKRIIEEERTKRQEEIIAKRKERQERTNDKNQEDIKKLKDYLKSGKTMQESADIMNYSLSYIYIIKRKSLQNNTWFTPEELKEVEEKKEKQKQKKEDVLKLREYVKQGYMYEEIAKKMNYSVGYLSDLRKIAIADNIWFTKEAIKEFKVLRKKREERERQRVQKEEQERLEKERKEKERLEKEKQAKLEREQKEYKKIKRLKLREYEEEYNKYRKLAKEEDKLELYGEENVQTEGRKKFIEILISLNNLGKLISDKDIEIVINTLYTYPEIANKDNIKLLILDANKKGGLKSSEKMIMELADILRKTKFYEPLVQYRIWIKKLALLPQIQDMKKQGMSNENIGKKLGISSSEVSIIFNNKEPDFSDFEMNI